MKKINIIYWIATIVFAGLMIFSAIGDVVLQPDAVAFMAKLGYPVYFVRFIGIAKVLGSIALLIPGFPRIKEWAYAGLAFDLFGAIYSNVAVAGFDPMMTFMLLWILPGVVSYIWFHKRQKALAAA